MKKPIFFSLFFALLVVGMNVTSAQSLWLDQLDLTGMDTGWGTPHAKKSVEGNPLAIAGQKFEHGVGTHAVSRMKIYLGQKATHFSVSVGVDDEAQKTASIEFYVLGDKKVLWKSGVMKKGDAPKKTDVDVRSIKILGSAAARLPRTALMC